jgi:hypothetical protein
MLELLATLLNGGLQVLSIAQAADSVLPLHSGLI